MIEDELIALEQETEALLALAEAAPIGGLIDLAYSAKTLTSQVNRLSDRIKDAQRLLLNLAKDLCEKNGLDGAVGQNARLTLAEQEYPTVDDWGAVFQYMQDTNNFQILQQRLAATRVKELLDAGDTIPGVSMTPTIEPQLRKL